jgi:hypothetical protein
LHRNIAILAKQVLLYIFYQSELVGLMWKDFILFFALFRCLPSSFFNVTCFFFYLSISCIRCVTPRCE